MLDVIEQINQTVQARADAAVIDLLPRLLAKYKVCGCQYHRILSSYVAAQIRLTKSKRAYNNEQIAESAYFVAIDNRDMWKERFHLTVCVCS